MSEHKFGDLYVGDDAAILASRLDDLDGRLYNVIKVLERIAQALEAIVPPSYSVSYGRTDTSESVTNTPSVTA